LLAGRSTAGTGSLGGSARAGALAAARRSKRTPRAIREITRIKGKKGDPYFDAFYATQVRMPGQRCSIGSDRRSCSPIPTRAHSAAWGPTDIPITYDPPIKDPSELAIERDAKADGPDLFVYWMQKEPARQLINLKNIPVMVMAGEASYHQVYDHCTVKCLNQAGVKPNTSACRTRAFTATATW
jgi:hypothetical protein